MTSVEPDGYLRSSSYSLWFPRLGAKENRVTAVPKDYRGPRLIAIEPCGLMYREQGLMKALYSYVESHPLTRNWIRFSDQTLNQRRSRSLENATIDLKDASDRLSYRLVADLMADTPVWPLVDSLRCTASHLPDGRSVPLRCYATMGNALTFPVETLCFWAIARAAGARSVSVYGDDIVVERQRVTACIEAFQTLGLLVNHEKTCYRTPFRESCGAEWFNGVDISIARFKVLDARSPATVMRLQTTISLLQERGFDVVAATLASKLSQLFPLYHALDRRRWNKGLQRVERLTFVEYQARKRDGAIPDEIGLYVWFTRGRLGLYQRRHQPYKPVWTSIYPEVDDTEVQKRILHVAITQANRR